MSDTTVIITQTGTTSVTVNGGPQGLNGAISVDAPVDGNHYARQSGAWVRPTASQVVFTPAAGVASTDVQGAIEELVDFVRGTLDQSLTAGDEVSITLTNAVTAPVVGVTKEVQNLNVTENKWDITVDDTRFDREDTALATTLTPSAVTGDITLALGAGSFAAADVGKLIVGNGGEAILTSAAGAATVQTDFTNTSAIASGDWSMYAADFKATGVEITGIDNVIVGSSFNEFVPDSAARTVNRLARLNTDEFILAYRTVSDSGPVEYAVIENNGTVKSSGNTVVATTDGSSSVWPAEGGMICWKNTANGYLEAALTDTLGGITSVGVLTNFVIMGNSGSGELIQLDNGNYIFYHGDNSDQNTLRYLIFDTNGTVVVASTAIRTNTTSNIFGFKANKLDNGNTFVTVKDGADIYLAIYDQDGVAVLAATAVLNLTSPGLVGACGVNANDIAIFYNKSGVGHHYTVFDQTGSVVKTEVNMSTVFPSTAAGGNAEQFLSGRCVYCTRLSSGTHKAVVIGTDYNIAVDDITVTSTATQGNSTYLELLSSGLIVITYPAQTAPGVYIVGMDEDGVVGSAAAPEAPVGYTPTNQYIPVVTNDTGQINTAYWQDINSLTTTETLSGQSAYYAFSNDDRTTFFIAQSAGERNIARLNLGSWEYNSNVTYGSETWSAAVTNSVFGALSEAMTVEVNRLTGAQVDALVDAECPTLADTLDLAIILFTNDSTKRPISDGVSINYDGAVVDQLAVNGTDYTIFTEDGVTVFFRALVTGNFKARIF
jgi:hypothetical protein